MELHDAKSKAVVSEERLYTSRLLVKIAGGELEEGVYGIFKLLYTRHVDGWEVAIETTPAIEEKSSWNSM